MLLLHRRVSKVHESIIEPFVVHRVPFERQPHVALVVVHQHRRGRPRDQRVDANVELSVSLEQERRVNVPLDDHITHVIISPDTRRTGKPTVDAAPALALVVLRCRPHDVAVKRTQIAHNMDATPSVRARGLANPIPVRTQGSVGGVKVGRFDRCVAANLAPVAGRLEDLVEVAFASCVGRIEEKAHFNGEGVIGIQRRTRRSTVGGGGRSVDTILEETQAIGGNVEAVTLREERHVFTVTRQVGQQRDEVGFARHDVVVRDVVDELLAFAERPEVNLGTPLDPLELERVAEVVFERELRPPSPTQRIHDHIPPVGLVHEEPRRLHPTLRPRRRGSVRAVRRLAALRTELSVALLAVVARQGLVLVVAVSRRKHRRCARLPRHAVVAPLVLLAVALAHAIEPGVDAAEVERFDRVARRGEAEAWVHLHMPLLPPCAERFLTKLPRPQADFHMRDAVHLLALFRVGVHALDEYQVARPNTRRHGIILRLIAASTDRYARARSELGQRVVLVRLVPAAKAEPKLFLQIVLPAAHQSTAVKEQRGLEIIGARLVVLARIRYAHVPGK